MKSSKKIKRGTLVYGGIFLVAGAIACILEMRTADASIKDALIWLVAGGLMFRNAILEDRLKEAERENIAFKTERKLD